MKAFELPQLAGTPVATRAASLELPSSMELDVRIDWGRAYLDREEANRLDRGAIVPLDRAADAPVDVLAAGRLIARGEVVVVDGNFAVRVTELIAGGVGFY